MSRSACQGGRIFLWLGLATLLAYFPVTANKFVWDDASLIVDNNSLRHPLLIFSTFFEYLPFVPHSTMPLFLAYAFKIYRPLMVLSFALDFKVWGLNPAGFHLTNLLLHLLNVYLVVLLARQLPYGQRFAPLAGLIFALHPVHSEALAAMLGRSDLMITAFSLMGLLAYHRFLRESRRFHRAMAYGFTLLCYLAGCLTKENGIIFPLLLIITERWAWAGDREKRGGWAQALSLTPFLALGLLYFWLHQAMVPPYGQEVWGGGRRQTALIMLIVLWKYFILLVFPAFSSPYYLLHRPEGLAYLRVLAGLLVLLGSFFLAVKFYCRLPLMTWAVAWIGFSLLPVSNIILIPGEIMAERWLYLPSVGFSIFLAWGIHAVFQGVGQLWKRCLLSFGVVILILAVIRIFYSIGLWKDERTLKLAIVKRYPESVMAHNNLGWVLISEGRIQEAEEQFYLAYRSNSGDPLVLSNLGAVFMRQGNWEKAIEFYRRAVARDPFLSAAQFNLGYAYHKQGQLDSAAAVYRRVLKLNPWDVETLTNLGIILNRKEEWVAAEEVFRQALVLEPQDTLLQSYWRKARNHEQLENR